MSKSSAAKHGDISQFAISFQCNCIIITHNHGDPSVSPEWSNDLTNKDTMWHGFGGGRLHNNSAVRGHRNVRWKTTPY